MPSRTLPLAVVTGLCLPAAAACARLPDADTLIQRQARQAARFENARGPLSAQKSAAIVAELKRKSGDIDVLDKQIALEQAIVGSPLTLGNQVTLLHDGAATWAAMFAAIRKARNHINLKSYIIEDDAMGQPFADLLVEQRGRGVQVNVIYDSVGAFNTPKAFVERVTDAGVAVLEFNPINPLSAKAQWPVNNRDHGKLLVPDQCLLRPRSATAGSAGRCRQTRCRCQADLAEPLRLRRRVSRRTLVPSRPVEGLIPTSPDSVASQGGWGARQIAVGVAAPDSRGR